MKKQNEIAIFETYRIKISNNEKDEVEKLKKSVTLENIKLNKKLSNISLIKQSRLSVMPISKSEWLEIIKISNN